MVGLHWLFSSRSLTIACTVATVLSGGEIQGANAAVLDRRQGETKSVTSTATAADSTTGAATTTTATATATTKDAKKDSATATTESTGASATAAPPDDDFPICDDPDVVFCTPKNETEVWPGETYYVTWNAKKYPSNSSITVELNYANSSVGGASAYSSPRTDNRMGYVTMTMEKDWLQGKSGNNLTLYLVMDDPTSGDPAVPQKGPTISLAPKPTDHYKPPPHTKATTLGLAVGLPVGLGVVFIILIGLCVGMRKRRQIGLGSVMGRNKKGYGSGKSRGERLGRSRRENDAIRLGELEEDPDRYTDDPNVQRGDPEQYNEERMTGQSFRPDVGQLKTWK